MDIELNSNNLPLNSILSINSSATRMACLELKQLLHARMAKASFFAPLAIYFLPIWHPFNSPYGYYSQARMAFNLTDLVGPSGLLFALARLAFCFARLASCSSAC